MSEFELYDRALLEYEKNKKTKESDISEADENSSDIEECLHKNITTENNVCLCIDCGEEMDKDLTHDKEWRYYGQSDNRHTSDPNRCQIRKIEDRNIYKDVKNMGFSDKIVNNANKFYTQVTKGKIYRGNSRKAIVFACIFHSFKLSGRPQSCETLITIFNLDRKAGLKGLKHVNLNAPKDSPIRTTYITPVNLIDEIMDKFIASSSQKEEVKKLYTDVKNKSSRLNRSRPQSVSSGVIYYWICLKKKDISIKEFTKKVGLSELTVNKIAKEIAEVLGTPDVI